MITNGHNPKKNSYVVDVKNLTKLYGTHCVVDHIDLKIKRGEVFGFLGPNGSGKTTTLRMLCGLLTPNYGEGTCLGYDILKESEKIKQHVGYMTQRFSLYEDLSVYENLDFIARLYLLPDRKNKINTVLDTLGFSKERRQQLGKQLSGGWKQRLALAATILHQPQLLLLDEPTAGVDPKARREFWDEIHSLAAQGITTLVTTHYMDEAERCHRLAYILAGKLLVVGTIADVIDHTGLHTWEVTGPDLYILAKQLEALPAISQVAHFGNTLHVTGLHEADLATAIAPFQQPPYTWKKTFSSLEDVFIHYSKEESK